MEERPDCSAWSFSITKAYSASVRAGFIIYKRDSETNKAAMVNTISDSYTMTNGLFRCVPCCGAFVKMQPTHRFSSDNTINSFLLCVRCTVNGPGMGKCSSGR